MRIILIDNYDSFTYNLVHYFGELGTEVKVYRNDKISVEGVLNEKPEAVVLSPGPGTPDQAGICLELIGKSFQNVPILGVCLGHQAIGQAFGGTIRREPPMHGKISEIFHHGLGVFANIPSPFNATRYHSLVVDQNHFPQELQATATTREGVIMGLEHRQFPVYGVQFHPESIMSEHGHQLLKNFMLLAQIFNKKPSRAA